MPKTATPRLAGLAVQDKPPAEIGAGLRNFVPSYNDFPTQGGTTPPSIDLDTRLENYSIGMGQGFSNQGRGLYQMITSPVQTARGLYEMGKYAAQNPRAAVSDVAGYVREGVTGGPLVMGRFIGENIGPGMSKPRPSRSDITVYHGSPRDVPALTYGENTLGTSTNRYDYGAGVNLSENPAVARNYMNRHGTENKGFFYTVDLPDEQAAKTINWNLPLKDQPINVRLAFEQLITKPESYKTRLQSFFGMPSNSFKQKVKQAISKDQKISDLEMLERIQDLSGSQLYELLVKSFHKPGKGVYLTKDPNASLKASYALKELGIPGVKYRSGISTPDKPFNNYVVFQDDILTILNKEAGK